MVDSLLLVMLMNLFSFLRDLMRDALGRAVEWCESKGFSIQARKTAMVVFTSKYKIINLKGMMVGKRKVTYFEENI